MGCLVWLVRGVSGVAISDAFSSLVLPHHRLTAVHDIERLVQRRSWVNVVFRILNFWA